MEVQDIFYPGIDIYIYLVDQGYINLGAGLYIIIILMFHIYHFIYLFRKAVELVVNKAFPNETLCRGK